MLRVVCPGAANLASAAVTFCHALRTQPVCDLPPWPARTALYGHATLQTSVLGPGCVPVGLWAVAGSRLGRQTELGTGRQMGLAGAHGPCRGRKELS